ncbi:hypothetical protein CcaverHIS002_0203170 [Cutaneotrichosporon cavernicola]|uniref:RRM domain-containing protein n=1 Tax=Cutaneotrichosporon cavernicola TaxID=279322 RepID=A0AA48KY31_9TREE|nr:uncharacterized protein CcaverHIS019_0203160 [Cutaneotrichosporon cavernicola]BEI81157.1 hypothetical protein CcaverHIS002_0203170 [Cutaneotrichosporon cavernicola]BEI88954.1 hypothetical protein CcaverHIS019_0203160 [Cutaneotrichosporon cavernicola]BEI96731.1 hypothetical protein CcaverHIS631_0203200 [Cutaneotrichosporon cavernicola]
MSSRSSSPSPSPVNLSLDYSNPPSPSMQLTLPIRPHSLPSCGDIAPPCPPSPAKSSTSSLSASAAPFAPNLVDTAMGRNATTDYLAHLAKEAEARYADSAKHHSGNDKGVGVTATTVVQFTQDAHLIEVAASLGISITFKDVTFLEHKCNGKSKGVAFINCHTTPKMMRLMKWFETHEFQGKKVSTSISSNANGRPSLPPPTHDKENGGLGYRPNNDGPARAPLPFLPTNSHGGVNFNRVPLHHRQQMQQMQQAGFLQGGSYGRAGGMNVYPAAQNTNPGYAADLVRKKVMAQPSPFYLGDWQDQTNAQPMIRTMRV